MASHGWPSSAAHGLCSRSASRRRCSSPSTSVRLGRMNLRPRTPNQRPFTSNRSPSAISNRSSSKATPFVPVVAGSTTSAMGIHKLPGSAERARARNSRCSTGPPPDGGRRTSRRSLTPRRTRAARDFLRAPALRCRAPRLTALSIACTSSRCSVSAWRAVAGGHGRLEAAEVRLDLRRVAAVLESLALGAQDPLLL